MTRLLLVVSLAGERIAFSAADIEAVVEIEGIVAAPGAPPHVAGLSALRSRVLTVIDCAAAIGAERGEAPVRDAVVAVIDGHPYALLVDGVEDMVEAEGDPAPLPQRLSGRWARVGKGMVEAEGRLLLLVDVAALIAGPAAAEAA
jgi:purine-binding chemotaxis protein CheW